MKMVLFGRFSVSSLLRGRWDHPWCLVGMPQVTAITELDITRAVRFDFNATKRRKSPKLDSACIKLAKSSMFAVALSDQINSYVLWDGKLSDKLCGWLLL